jgi:hypothetical protein
LNKTACETNELPTRDMLLGGSAVSLRDGASRWAGRVQGSPQFTAKAELAFVREAQKICALRKYQLLEKMSGFVLGEMFGLGLIGVTNDFQTID